MSDLGNVCQYLQLLPEFDGNFNILKRFIYLCDQIVNKYVNEDPENELAKSFVINGILNKITGSAANTINIHGDCKNWEEIKKILIDNFSDNRDEADLCTELFLLSQNYQSPQEFYDQCQQIFSALMTYVTLHDKLDTTVEAKRKLYEKLTLRAFLNGLTEPVGSRVRCMRPNTMEKALEFAQEELNIIKLQQHKNTFKHEIPQRQPLNLYKPQHSGGRGLFGGGGVESKMCGMPASAFGASQTNSSKPLEMDKPSINTTVQKF